MDPTVFVGLTYSFIFGVMFGDVGQGLLLLIGGALIYHLRRSSGGDYLHSRILLHNLRIYVRKYLRI